MEQTQLYLRPLRMEDAPAMLSWMNDADSVRYLGGGFQRKRTLKDVQDLIALTLDGEFTGETWAVAEKESGEYLGECRLMLPDAAARRAEIAIVLLPKARGRGLGRQALELLLKRAFCELQYNRLYLNCAQANQPARLLYERAGFTLEGRLRSHMRSNDGALEDVLIYGLLREEYDARHLAQ